MVQHRPNSSEHVFQFGQISVRLRRFRVAFLNRGLRPDVGQLRPGFDSDLSDVGQIWPEFGGPLSGTNFDARSAVASPDRFVGRSARDAGGPGYDGRQRESRVARTSPPSGSPCAPRKVASGGLHLNEHDPRRCPGSEVVQKPPSSCPSAARKLFLERRPGPNSAKSFRFGPFFGQMGPVCDNVWPNLTNHCPGWPTFAER